MFKYYAKTKKGLLFMKVFQYQALNDNYNWIVSCEETKECMGVDIFNTDTFFNYIEKNELKLIGILNTHHHQDHSGGNSKVFEKYPHLKFYGSRYDYDNKRIACQNVALGENDIVKIGKSELKVIDIVGHTLGHIAYYNDEIAFVGDTLFVSGCGRLFEGTPSQMYHSLEKLVSVLKPKTQIYCGHEYTLSNLNFCFALNENYFKLYKNEIEELRNNNVMTVPTNIEKELNFNPFLMVMNEDLKKDIFKLTCSGEEAFAILRKKKDTF